MLTKHLLNHVRALQRAQLTQLGTALPKSVLHCHAGHGAMSCPVHALTAKIHCGQKPLKGRLQRSHASLLHGVPEADLGSPAHVQYNRVQAHDGMQRFPIGTMHAAKQALRRVLTAVLRISCSSGGCLRTPGLPPATGPQCQLRPPGPPCAPSVPAVSTEQGDLQHRPVLDLLG